MKFSIKDFFSKCDRIRRKLRIWSHHLVKKSLMENFIFCAVYVLSVRFFGKVSRIFAVDFFLYKYSYLSYQLRKGIIEL